MVRGFTATIGATAGPTALTITRTNSTVSEICRMAISSFEHDEKMEQKK
jgi:hypothetical protein